MKKLIVRIATVALLVFPLMLSAQNSYIEKLYEKYSGEDGVTSVNISKEMFQLMMAFDVGNNEDAEAIQDVIDNLKGMKILKYDGDQGPDLAVFRKSVLDILEKKDFKELMVVVEEGQKIKFMINKKGKDIIELLLITDEDDELAVISFFGIIDLNAISKMSKNLQIGGLENLRKLKKDIDN
jgi:hypothetical protein